MRALTGRAPAADASPATRRVALSGDGPHVVAVVADTHARPHPAALAQLRALAPAAILHAGDIGDLAVVDALAEVAPVVVVRGNIDPLRPETPDELIVELAGDATLRVLLTHIAVRGPRLQRPVRARARGLGCALVVCGHSHVPLVADDAGIAVFNPGSVGPRRFTLPITFGVITHAAGRFSFHHVDVETGARWDPRAAARA